MERLTGSKPGSLPMRGLRTPGGLPWIPWKWVRRRHAPGAWEELARLFGAYGRVLAMVDIEKVWSTVPPRSMDDGCRRCGQCCAELLPEPVPAETVHQWEVAGNPVHIFHAPVSEGPRAGRFSTGWYHDGVRLRMCPLLLRDPLSGHKFCVVYHLGPGHRPPGCEGFKPNWPHCEVSQRPLVP